MFVNIPPVVENLKLMKKEIQNLIDNLMTYEKAVKLIDRWDDPLKLEINECIEKIRKLISGLMERYLKITKQADNIMLDLKGKYLKNNFKDGL
ncbi:MAG: hypothetical protein IJX17_04915 [Clostridia bacterium]|nr:hypothetical protein [Clostridia bacterium]